MADLTFAGKRFLITGASSGLGRAVAEALAAAGARVVLVGRNAERLQAAQSACTAGAPQIVPFDLSEGLEDVPGWMKALASADGPFDGVVHAAGVQLTKPLRMVKPADLDAVFRINVTAAFMLAKGFRQPGVHAGTGSLVLFSSAIAKAGSPARAVYAASKGAIEAATRSLALELAPEGLRVNCVAPGFVASEMLAAMAEKLGAEQMERIQVRHPLGFGTPADVAAAVLYLLHDQTRWVTGTTLAVDGGYTAQ